MPEQTGNVISADAGIIDKKKKKKEQKRKQLHLHRTLGLRDSVCICVLIILETSLHHISYFISYLSHVFYCKIIERNCGKSTRNYLLKSCSAKLWLISIHLPWKIFYYMWLYLAYCWLFLDQKKSYSEWKVQHILDFPVKAYIYER